MGLTAKQAPYTGPYSVDGYGKHRGPTAVALKRAMARMGYLPWEPTKWDDRFNVKLEVALDKWDKGKGGYAEGRWTKLRGCKVPAGQPHAGEAALDSVCCTLIRAEARATAAVVPALGPVYNGGPSVLQYDLTHRTDGIDLYPAFDTAFAGGTGIIAAEPMTVFQASNSAPGEAFFLRGQSRLKWWIAHLDRAQPVGRSFAKGDFLGRVLATSVGGGSHAHVAINVEDVWGAGRQMLYGSSGRGPDYTHGSPLIGTQLRDGP